MLCIVPWVFTWTSFLSHPDPLLTFLLQILVLALFQCGFFCEIKASLPWFCFMQNKDCTRKGVFQFTAWPTDKQFHFKLTRNEQFFIPVEMAVSPYNQDKVEIGSTHRINSLDQTKSFNLCFTSTSFTSSCLEGYNLPSAYMNSAMNIISSANIPGEFNLES